MVFAVTSRKSGKGGKKPKNTQESTPKVSLQRSTRERKSKDKVAGK